MGSNRKELASSVVVNLMITLATVGIVWNIWSYFSTNEITASVPLVGSDFKISGVNPESAQLHALVFLSSGCKFCEQSMPFYERVRRISGSGKVNLVAFFDHSDDGASAYMKRFKLFDAEPHRADFGSLGIKATPTFVLLDQSGKVLKSSVGKLKSETEQEIEHYFKSVTTQ